MIGGERSDQRLLALPLSKKSTDQAVSLICLALLHSTFNVAKKIKTEIQTKTDDRLNKVNLPGLNSLPAGTGRSMLLFLHSNKCCLATVVASYE